MTSRKKKEQSDSKELVEEKKEESLDSAEIYDDKTVLADDYQEEPEKLIYSGICIDGPMNGQQGESRYPEGFVLIDKFNSRAWVYDYDPETRTFTAREQDIHDRVLAQRAANGDDYDVRAYDKGSVIRGNISE